jgi:hypothetical protein
MSQLGLNPKLQWNRLWNLVMEVLVAEVLVVVFKVDVFNLNHIFKIKTETIELSSCFAYYIAKKQGVKL